MCMTSFESISFLANVLRILLFITNTQHPNHVCLMILNLLVNYFLYILFFNLYKMSNNIWLNQTKCSTYTTWMCFEKPTNKQKQRQTKTNKQKAFCKVFCIIFIFNVQQYLVKSNHPLNKTWDAFSKH